jgi:hypothetical protein
MPGSVASDEFDHEDVCKALSTPALTPSNYQQAFIVDIDSIQTHGIGAADITKLKANGFYTVAVSPTQSSLSIHGIKFNTTSPSTAQLAKPFSKSKASAKSKSKK